MQSESQSEQPLAPYVQNEFQRQAREKVIWTLQYAQPQDLAEIHRTKAQIAVLDLSPFFFQAIHGTEDGLDILNDVADAILTTESALVVQAEARQCVWMLFQIGQLVSDHAVSTPQGQLFKEAFLGWVVATTAYLAQRPLEEHSLKVLVQKIEKLQCPQKPMVLGYDNKDALFYARTAAMLVSRFAEKGADGILKLPAISHEYLQQLTGAQFFYTMQEGKLNELSQEMRFGSRRNQPQLLNIQKDILLMENWTEQDWQKFTNQIIDGAMGEYYPDLLKKYDSQTYQAQVMQFFIDGLKPLANFLKALPVAFTELRPLGGNNTGMSAQTAAKYWNVRLK